MVPVRDPLNQDFLNKILARALTGRLTKAEAARRLGVSRKTVYLWLKTFPRRSLPPQARVSPDDILKVAVANPQLGPKQIAAFLTERGKKISQRGIWLILKKRGLNRRQEREVYSFNLRQARQAQDRTYPKILRFSPEARKRMVEEVVLAGKKVGEVAQAYNLSRKTLAKWKKRYLTAQTQGENLLHTLADQHPTGAAHPRGVEAKVVKAILDLVISNPSLTSHQIAASLAVVGNHGVQNVLARHQLNTRALRLSYARRGRLGTQS